MSIFNEILLETNLLNEGINVVTAEKIKDAIENHKEVSIQYDENKTKKKDKNTKPSKYGRSWRYIWPIVYGETCDRSLGKNAGTGKMAVWAFQNGGSHSQTPPQSGTNKGKPYGWKLFLLDNIVSWFNQENTETDKTHTFTPENIEGFKDPKFNPSKYFHKIVYPENLSGTEDTQNKETNKGEIETTPNKKEWANQYNAEKPLKLDNMGNLSYSSNKDNNVNLPQQNIVNNDGEGNKLEAPETKPITKLDIEDVPPPTPVQQSKVVTDDEPITKDDIDTNNDIDNEEEEENKADITKIFESYIMRWKNL